MNTQDSLATDLQTAYEVLSRANDAIGHNRLGIWEIAAKRDVVAELCMEKVLSKKHDSRAVRLYKTIYEAILQVLLQKFEASLTESSLAVLNEEKL